MSPRFLFKKWLELEKRMGDEAGVENVKDTAIEWTQNAVNGRPEQEQD
jgi:rRNA biogenesis protein RRP5